MGAEWKSVTEAVCRTVQQPVYGKLRYHSVQDAEACAPIYRQEPHESAELAEPGGQAPAGEKEPIPARAEAATEKEPIPAQAEAAAEKEPIPAQAAAATEKEPIPAQAAAAAEKEPIPAQAAAATEKEPIPAQAAAAAEKEPIPAQARAALWEDSTENIVMSRENAALAKVCDVTTEKAAVRAGRMQTIYQEMTLEELFCE